LEETGCASFASSFFDFLVDECCGDTGRETVVDVDDGDAGGATVEHGQQGRETPEAGAVPDARGHGDYGAADQATDDTGEGTFHSSDNDEHVCLLEFRKVPEKTVQTRDTNITDELGALAHYFSGNLGLGGDRQVGGAGGDDGQDRFGGRGLNLLQDDGTSKFVVPGIGEFSGSSQSLEYMGLGAGSQNVVSLGGEILEDSNDLFNGFARTEDHLGEAATDLAMMVDAGKAEIFKRQMAELLDGLVYVDLALLELL